jgi:hypothetical protein
MKIIILYYMKENYLYEKRKNSKLCTNKHYRKREHDFRKKTGKTMKFALPM